MDYLNQVTQHCKRLQNQYGVSNMKYPLHEPTVMEAYKAGLSAEDCARNLLVFEKTTTK